MWIIQELTQDYVLKGVGWLEYYLGCDVLDLDDTWKKDKVKKAISSETYIKNVISKFKTIFGNTIHEFKTPMEVTYHLELETTPFLSPKEASLYCGLIGSANRVITQGCFDIHCAVNSLSRFAMAPREGHLQAIKQVFGYLKHCNNGKLLINANMRDWSSFKQEMHNWQELYPNAIEELPIGVPKAKGLKT